MENNEHKNVVHNPVNERTIERTEVLLDQITSLEEQLGLAHDTIGSLTSLLSFERKRNAS